MSMFDFSSHEQALVETQEQTEEKVLSNNEKETEEVKVNVEDTNPEVVDKEEIPEKEEENSESPANSDDVFTPLAEFLKEQGFFPNLDKEIKSAEELAEAFKEEIKRNEFADLTEEQKEYLTALREGVPDALYREHVQAATTFKSVTDDILADNEDIRKQVVIQDLIHSGLSPERAERQWQRIYDLGDSLEESKAARDNLIQKEEKEYQQKIQIEKQRAIEMKKAQEKQLNDLKNNVYSQEKLFDTFPVSQGMKDKVYKTMTEVVAYTETNQPVNKLMKHRMDNPVDFETKLYYLYELTNGFKDINKFVTKSTTSAAKKLKDAVNSANFIKSGAEGSFNQENFTGPPIVSL